MVRRVIVSSKLKLFSNEGEGKPSVNSANIVSGNRPETGLPIHGQVEVEVKLHGGPNARSLKSPAMRCG